MDKPTVSIEYLDNKDNKHSVIAFGLALDNEEGLHMSRSGKELTWVAIQGEVGDWCVYTHFTSHCLEYIKQYGDKVCTRRNIENILHITDEVWARYRV